MNRCEAELIERLKDGESAAFEEFTQQYGSRIYDALCWLCCDRTLAEDLAQETIVAVFRGIGRFRGGSSLYSWVYQIAVRVANRQRKRRTHPCVPLDQVAEVQAPDDTGEQADRAMLRDSIREALRDLPVGQRECIVLHCLQGMSHSETARTLGRPLGTVKWQIAQGLHNLRDSLKRMEAN